MVDIDYILRDDSGQHSTEEYEMAAELKTLREMAKLAITHLHLQEEYDAHPWEVSPVSVLNSRQKLSDFVFENELTQRYGAAK